MATSRRQRGVILTQLGLQKLQAAQRRSELQDNEGTRYTLEQLSDRMGLDPGTVAKVLAAESGVDKQTVLRAFAAFDLELTLQDYHKLGKPEQKVAPTVLSSDQDWGEAVDTTYFYGRAEEILLLSQWIKQDHCRLIAILGIGGIGKTTLATQLSEMFCQDFEFLIWRSLRHAPPIEELLTDLIRFLSRQSENTLSRSTSAQMLRLMEYLRQHRCLVILDNLESILQEGVQAGSYRPGYESYGTLLQQIGSARHQSCILLTSREKPHEIAHLEGATLPVRSLRLAGLERDDAEQILQDKGLQGDAAAKQQLVDRYRGHPLALKVVSTSICDLFNGNIADFLQQDATFFSSLRILLEQQFNRLTTLEQQVMYWLAIEREAVTLADLRGNIVPTIAPHVLLEALESLRRRSLIESNQSSFTQQSVVMEYVTERLIQGVCQEICAPPNTENLGLLQTHALLKATTKDHIREVQTKLIGQPIVDALMQRLGDRAMVEQQLMHWVSWQQQRPFTPSYLGGNVLTLLSLMGSDLSDRDFSQLAIWQADLRQVSLHNVNFAHTDLSNTVFAQTFGGITSVAFSPNGELLVAGDDHNEIHLWSVSEEQPRLILRGHTDWVWAVVFNPNAPILVSASEDQTIRIWDIATGQCLRVLRGHTSWVRSLSISPDGRTIASGSSDHTIKLWDVHSGTCYQTLQGHGNWVWSVSFSPDGHTIASGGTDQTVRLWDAATGECLRILNGHEGAVYEVTFSPDGQMIASSGYDQTVRLWAVNGTPKEVLRGHRSAIRAVVFSPDGQLLASGSNDQTVRLWDTETKQCIRVLHAEDNWVRAIAFSPNSQLLATGSNAQTLRLWQVATGHRLRTWHGQTGQVWAVAYAPKVSDRNDYILASGSGNHDIQLWQPQTQQLLKTLQGHTNWVWSIAFHPTESILASGSEDETIRLWQYQTGQCLRLLQGHTGAVRSIAFSPDGTQLASASEDETVRQWDWQTGRMLQRLSGHTNWVRSVVFSPDGQWLASGSLDCTARIWSAQTGECCQILTAHAGSVRSVAFSPDGRWLATGSEDETVRLWNVYTGNCIAILEENIGQAWSICFSLDGRLLAIASTLPEIQVWDVQLHQKVQTLHGHTGQNWAVAFSPDGRFLASGSADQTIRCWQVDQGVCLATLQSQKRYEGLNMTGATGLTLAHRITLQSLGGVDYHDEY